MLSSTTQKIRVGKNCAYTWSKSTNVVFSPVNTDNQLMSKWGEGGVNRPTWESICPIHIAVQNNDMVC